MYYQGQEIKTLYHQGRQITLLYYQGMVVYRVGGPEGETYAIINTLDEAKSLLPDTHFDWVWANDKGKWYRYNNLGQYEEYGIYANTIEEYREEWIEVDVPEELFTTPIKPTINTEAHIEGTLKTRGDALYYGYTHSDDSKDYRWFNAMMRQVYWDMNNSRLNTSISGIRVGDYIDMTIGNNFMKGTMGSYNINLATTNPQPNIASPNYLNINLSAIDIIDFVIYDDGEEVYHILRREDGSHYGIERKIFGTTTYRGKLATIDGREYLYDGNGWIEVGNASIANADVEIINGFIGGDLIDNTREYSTTSSGSSLKYTIDNNISQFGIYLGLSKNYAGETFTITASEPNSEVVQHQLKRSDRITFNKYYEYFTYDNLQAGDVITVKFSSVYNISSWGGGYTYAPTMFVVDAPYEYPEPIRFREYETFSEFVFDTEKYGNCIVHILEGDEFYGYDYYKNVNPIDNQIFQYKATEQVIPYTSKANYITSLYNSDTGEGKILYSDVITKLPNEEFKGNQTLTEYILPSSVEEFGTNVFNGCVNLTTFDVGNCKLTNGLFQNTHISDIIINDDFIPENCFRECSHLNSVTFAYPDTITIWDSAFRESVINDMDGNKIGILGGGAFYSARLPETLYLPNISGGLPIQCFCNAKGIHNITFGPNVTSLGDMLFYQTPIESIIFEDAGKITSAHIGAFFRTYNVTTLRVPNIAISFRLYAEGTSGEHTTMPLDRDALIQVFNDLATVTDKTLTLGPELLAKLTDEDIAIATGKGWTIM